MGKIQACDNQIDAQQTHIFLQWDFSGLLNKLRIGIAPFGRFYLLDLARELAAPKDELMSPGRDTAIVRTCLGRIALLGRIIR